MNSLEKQKLIEKIVLFEWFKVEELLEKKVIAAIRKRQKNIPGLRQDPLKYTAVWGDGQLTPGCEKCCLQGKWTQIRTTSKCNLSCNFCYYYDTHDIPERELIPKDIYMIGEKYFTEDDIKLLVEIQGGRFLNGVAWLHFEPLLEIDKLLAPMKYINKKGYHQWLYTNGVFADKENLKKLADAGLNEIRFNLASTNCSDAVIKNMEIARKYFRFVCIESPVFTAFYDSFMKKRKAILNTGVNQINLAELQLFKKTARHFKGEGMIYRYRKGYVSPIKSRQLTYDIFDLAVREKWKNIVLNDCSNETKFYRGVHAPEVNYFGHMVYNPTYKLKIDFFENALRYLCQLEGKNSKSKRDLKSCWEKIQASL